MTSLLAIAIIGLIVWLINMQDQLAGLTKRLEQLEQPKTSAAPKTPLPPVPAAPAVLPAAAPARTAFPSQPKEVPTALQSPAPRPTPAPQRPAQPISAEPKKPFSPVKLFAWVGGFAFLLAAIFGIKYSLDHGFLSPTLRFIGLLLIGVAAWASGVCIKKGAYTITAHTLTACGACICFATWFAGYAFFHILGMYTAFGCMVLTALLALATAVWKKTAYMGILAQITAFLAPLLLTDLGDHLPFLLVYLALINTAALAAAYRHKWKHQFITSSIFTGCFLLTLITSSSGQYTSMLMGAVCFFCFLYAAGGALLQSGPILLVAFFFMGHCMLFADADHPASYVWLTLGAAAFMAVPFVFKRSFLTQRLAWGLSAVEGLWTCLLLTEGLGWAHGLIPLCFALVFAGLTFFVWKWPPEQDPARNEHLAWLCASAVLCVSWALAKQFTQAQLTLAFALEGCALIWLERRLPVRLLSVLGKWLLSLAAVRLVLNPFVLEYSTPKSIFNWFLYIYPLCAASAFLGAYGWKNKEQTGSIHWLQGLGGLILFALLNIEIAVAYSGGHGISLEIFGSFSVATAYTAAWLLSGGLCLCLALHSKSVWLHRSGLVLVGVSVAKLFLHDVWRLPLGMRILVLLGVAVVLVALSFMYQHVRAAKK